MRRRRLIHLFINLPASDIQALIQVPFSQNTDLQCFLYYYPSSMDIPQKESLPREEQQ